MSNSDPYDQEAVIFIRFCLTVHSVVVEDKGARHCSSEAAGDTHGPIIGR